MFNQTMSMETMIDFQDSSFFEAITDLFDRAQSGTITDKELQDGFNQFAKDRIGFNIQFVVDKRLDANAYAIPVILDATSTLLKPYEGLLSNMMRRQVYDEYKPIAQKIAKGEIDATGMMDYKNAKVSGMFSQIPVKCAITRGMFKMATPAQCAAIMLHELGHVWTFFSYMGVTTYRNAVISNAVAEVTGAKTEQERFKVIMANDNFWGLQLPVEDVAKLDIDEMTNVLIGAMTNTFTDSVGYTQYDENTSEVIADQFAIRFGAGQDLLAGLYKLLGNRSGQIKYQSSIMFIISLATTAMAYLNPITLLFGIAGILATSYSSVNEEAGWTYDNDTERYQRMRNEVVGQLKKRNVAPEVAAGVLRQLAAMDKILAKSTYLTSLPGWVGKMIFRKKGALVKRKEYQQLIESLLANDLYVTSAKFRQLGNR